LDNPAFPRHVWIYKTPGSVKQSAGLCKPAILIMQLPAEATLLRVYLGESDQWEHQPLYEAIVLRAREHHLAGATVLRGPMGFGESSRLHTSKILRLSSDLPLVIEIVDCEERIQAFLPVLKSMMQGGLITLEKVRVVLSQGAPSADSAGSVPHG
jgi:PII-like signaling protein